MKHETKVQGSFCSVKDVFVQVGSSSSFFWLTVVLYAVTSLLFAGQIAAFIATDSCPYFWLTPFVCALAFLQIARTCRHPDDIPLGFVDAVRFLQGYYRFLLGLTVIVITVAVCGFVILSTAPVDYEREIAVFFNAHSPGLYQKIYSVFVALTEGAYYENFIRTLVISFVTAVMIVFALAAIVYWLVLGFLKALRNALDGQEAPVTLPWILPVLCYVTAGIGLALAVSVIKAAPFFIPLFLLFSCGAWMMGFMVLKIKKALSV